MWEFQDRQDRQEREQPLNPEHSEYRPFASLFRWRHLSLDMRLLKVYLVIVAGGGLIESIWMQAMVYTLAAIAMVLASLAYRIRRQWHWPGADHRDIASALVTLLAILTFAALYTLIDARFLHPKNYPLSENAVLGWTTFVVALCIAAVLRSLNVLSTWKEQFLYDCERPEWDRPS